MQWRTHHSNNDKEQKHVQVELSQSLLYVYVFAQQCHFVDVYGDKTHDGRYQYPGRTGAVYDTRPPVSLYMQYLSIQETLNMFLELKKYVEHIGLALKKVKPSKTAISINKTNIIFMSTNRGLSATPNIRIYNLKWRSSNTCRKRKWQLMTFALLTSITDYIFID
jgi:hypothetical protein